MPDVTESDRRTALRVSLFVHYVSDGRAVFVRTGHTSFQAAALLTILNSEVTSARMLLDGRAVWMRMPYLHAHTMLEDIRVAAGGFPQHERVKASTIMTSKP